MSDYVFQEYPKAMYRNGEYMAVDNKREEKAAAKDGWLDYYADQRRLGTPKDEAPQAPAPQEPALAPEPEAPAAAPAAAPADAASAG